ncbi:PAS domain-containing protein [Methylobacterium planeticum]|uniref:PAS domain-containing protein n=1 Tax=Methylobacterium planeticum TaxID=2615211 RepID=UPI0017819FC1|nr:PAS domain-containing protein [Methylobacterium planeticum]
MDVTMRDDGPNGVSLNRSGLAFSSREFLRLIEDQGLTGNWGWTFDTNVQVWSAGLFRLLGLQASDMLPSYDLLLGLVHPEDKPELETTAEIMQGGILRDHVFRVIRPDGSIRVLSSRGEVYFTSEGRPRAAAGTFLDVTERERLATISAFEKQRQRVLAQTARIFTCSNRVVPFVEYPPEFVDLAGLQRQDLLDNWLAHVAREEWAFWQDESLRLLATGKPFIEIPTLNLVGNERARFRYTMVPVYEADASIGCWSAVISPVETPFATFGGELRQGLEQSVQGRHLRAARGLLGWSMMDLARASGLSFSTVRRLEDDGEATASRSRHLAVAALRTAGIQFSLLDSSTIAVGQR